MFRIIPYINECFMLLSAVFMAVGWYQIRRGRKELHKRLMLLGTVMAALFFIGYAAKTVLVGDTTFGGPASLKPPYQIFLQTHTILATVGAILGIVTLRYAYVQAFSKHKKIGPWTVVIWFITTASGLAVFLLLYIIYPPGPTTNMFRSWLGH
jgi:putative membrane protein